MYPYPVLGPFDLYDLFLLFGAVSCLFLFRFLSERTGIPARLANLALAGGIGGIGVGYATAVLFQAFYDYRESGVFSLSATTGATFFGGLIGGAAFFLLIYFAVGHFLFPDQTHRRLFFPVTGQVAAAIALAHGFGRIGCLMAGCCYGRVCDAWYGVYLPALGQKTVPTQAIEAVFLFLLCAVLCRRALQKKADGLPLYMTAYGVFRFFIEYLRADDRGASFVPFLSPSQLTALFLFAGGVVLSVFAERTARRRAV